MSSLNDEKPAVEGFEKEEVLKDAGNYRLAEEDVPLEQRRMEARVLFVNSSPFLVLFLIRTSRKVDWRLIPILGILYSVAGLDRVNVSNRPPLICYFLISIALQRSSLGYG